MAIAEHLVEQRSRDRGLDQHRSNWWSRGRRPRIVAVTPWQGSDTRVSTNGGVARAPVLGDPAGNATQRQAKHCAAVAQRDGPPARRGPAARAATGDGSPRPSCHEKTSSIGHSDMLVSGSDGAAPPAGRCALVDRVPGSSTGETRRVYVRSRPDLPRTARVPSLDPEQESGTRGRRNRGLGDACDGCLGPNLSRSVAVARPGFPRKAWVSRTEEKRTDVDILSSIASRAEASHASPCNEPEACSRKRDGNATLVAEPMTSRSRSRDESCRGSVVLKGAGRGFCAGVDLPATLEVHRSAGRRGRVRTPSATNPYRGR